MDAQHAAAHQGDLSSKVVRETFPCQRDLLITPSEDLPNDIDMLRGPQSFHCAPSRSISGQRVDRLLEMLSSALNKEIGEAKGSLSTAQRMSKFKNIFCIGINNVTRTLEHMPFVQSKWRQTKSSNLLATINEPVRGEENDNQGCRRVANYKTKGSLNAIHLQAVIAVSDVHPRLLVSHLPYLTASRNVPLLNISAGNGTGSIRLGRIFELRTAIAVGLKSGNFEINRAMQSFLDDHS